tara:strand:+ start:269 stop:751 length:483 start_codon:yes stop_codon:yes gene_type:complete
MDVNQVGQTAAKMALKYNADVAFLVEVQESQQTNYGVAETIVEVGCQVISAASGQIFTDAQIRVSGLTAQKAAVKAGQQLAQRLVNNVKIQFANLAHQGNRYSVVSRASTAIDRPAVCAEQWKVFVGSAMSNRTPLPWMTIQLRRTLLVCLQSSKAPRIS